MSSQTCIVQSWNGWIHFFGGWRTILIYSRCFFCIYACSVGFHQCTIQTSFCHDIGSSFLILSKEHPINIRRTGIITKINSGTIEASVSTCILNWCSGISGITSSRLQTVNTVYLGYVPYITSILIFFISKAPTLRITEEKFGVIICIKKLPTR